MSCSGLGRTSQICERCTPSVRKTGTAHRCEENHSLRLSTEYETATQFGLSATYKRHVRVRPAFPEETSKVVVGSAGRDRGGADRSGCARLSRVAPLYRDCAVSRERDGAAYDRASEREHRAGG